MSPKQVLFSWNVLLIVVVASLFWGLQTSGLIHGTSVLGWPPHSLKEWIMCSLRFIPSTVFILWDMSCLKTTFHGYLLVPAGKILSDSGTRFFGRFFTVKLLFWKIFPTNLHKTVNYPIIPFCDFWCHYNQTFIEVFYSRARLQETGEDDQNFKKAMLDDEVSDKTKKANGSK